MHQNLTTLVKTIICFIAPLAIINAQNPNPSTEIDQFIESHMVDENLPGVSTIVVKNGKIVWQESYGYADIEKGVQVEDTTVFLLASISKVFAGTAAMQAQELDSLHIDDDVDHYLPWNVDIPDYPSDPVTIKQLLTHTASIDDYSEVTNSYYEYPDPTLSLADCMQQYFAKDGSDYDDQLNFLQAKPGSIYKYSNMGTALLGYVVEEAVDQSFNTFCIDQLFTPLSMQKTGWYYADFDPDDVATPYAYENNNYIPYPQYGWADYPNGQLRSNVVDLSNFMIAYLNDGYLDSEKILEKESINEMLQLQVPSLSDKQGLIWYKEAFAYSGGTVSLWGHNGGEDGVSTEMYLDTLNDIGVCVLSNGENSCFEIAEALYDYAMTLTSTSTSDALRDENLIHLYPNPVSNSFRFYSQNNDDQYYSIDIIDISGRKHQSIKVTDNQLIDISALSSGIYFIAVQNESNETIALKKIVKE